MVQTTRQKRWYNFNNKQRRKQEERLRFRDKDDRDAMIKATTKENMYKAAGR